MPFLRTAARLLRFRSLRVYSFGITQREYFSRSLSITVSPPMEMLKLSSNTLE